MNGSGSILLEHAAQCVVNGLWQGLLVAAVVALALRLLPGVTAAQRFAVWAAAFAVALVLPFAPALAHGSAGAPALRAGFGWGAALVSVWIAAAAVRVGALLRQGLRVRRIWLAARPVAVPAEVQRLLDACPRAAEVCVSEDVSAPSVIGFFRPRLLVPAAMFDSLSGGELRQIALHECEHLRRYDDWLNLLQKSALALFPLNPALMWVDRRLGLERELACDAGVVAATGAPLDYAECLTRLAEHRMGRSGIALALSAWARRSELARRVYQLLQPARRLSGARGSLAAVACVLVAAAAGVMHAPRVVSFAPVVAPTLAAVPALEPPAAAVPVVFHAPVARPVSVAVRRVVAARRQVRPAAVPRMYNVSATQRFAPALDGSARMVSVGFSYSYAAVPFGDGWLIVQL